MIKQNSLVPNICAAILLSVAALFIILGYKHFSLWSQITSLFGVSPLVLIEIFHPHALRYLVVYPVIKFSQVTGLDMDILFSLYVLVTLYVMSITLSNTLRIVNQNHVVPSQYYRVILFAVSLPILLFMNGRMVFSLLGESLIIYSQIVFLSKYISINTSKIYYYLGVQAAGLVLSSVSSGTFSVAFCAIEVFMLSITLVDYRKKIGIKHYIISNILFLSLFSMFEVQFILKNLCYFNSLTNNTIKFCQNFVSLSDNFSEQSSYIEHDSLINAALKHGPMGLVPEDSIAIKNLMLFLFPFGFFVAFFSYFYAPIKDKNLSPIFTFIGVSLALGIFGISTFLQLILPAFFIIICFSLKIISKRLNFS